MNKLLSILSLFLLLSLSAAAQPVRETSPQSVTSLVQRGMFGKDLYLPKVTTPPTGHVLGITGGVDTTANAVFCITDSSVYLYLGNGNWIAQVNLSKLNQALNNFGFQQVLNNNPNLSQNSYIQGSGHNFNLTGINTSDTFKVNNWGTALFNNQNTVFNSTTTYFNSSAGTYFNNAVIEGPFYIRGTGFTAPLTQLANVGGSGYVYMNGQNWRDTIAMFADLRSTIAAGTTPLNVFSGNTFRGIKYYPYQSKIGFGGNNDTTAYVINDTLASIGFIKFISAPNTKAVAPLLAATFFNNINKRYTDTTAQLFAPSESVYSLWNTSGHDTTRVNNYTSPIQMPFLTLNNINNLSDSLHIIALNKGMGSAFAIAGALYKPLDYRDTTGLNVYYDIQQPVAGIAPSVILPKHGNIGTYAYFYAGKKGYANINDPNGLQSNAVFHPYGVYIDALGNNTNLDSAIVQNGLNNPILLNSNNINTPNIPTGNNTDFVQTVSSAGKHGKITHTLLTQQVWVDSLGSDITGTVGDINRPFQTVQAAINAVNPYATIYVGKGTFASPTTFKNGLKIIGSGRGEPNWAITINGLGVQPTISSPTQMIGGTIFNGRFNYSGYNDLTLEHFTVDVGLTWCNTYNGGAATDGLFSAQITGSTSYDGAHALQTQNSPNYGLYVNDVGALCRDSVAAVHAMLFENQMNPKLTNLYTYYGTHGIVLKTIGGEITHTHSYGHHSDGFIIKSNDYAYGYATSAEDIYVSSIVGNDGAGIALVGESNGILAYVKINNFHVEYTKNGVTGSSNSGGSITGVQLNNGLCYSIAGNNIFFGDSSTTNLSISSVDARVSTGVAFYIVDKTGFDKIVNCGAYNSTTGFYLSTANVAGAKVLAVNTHAQSNSSVDYNITNNVYGLNNYSASATITGAFKKDALTGTNIVAGFDVFGNPASTGVTVAQLKPTLDSVLANGSTSSRNISLTNAAAQLNIGTSTNIAPLTLCASCSTVLDSALNANKTIWSLGGPTAGGNNMRYRGWLRRTTQGGYTFTTAVVHHAVDVDGSFATPGVNTRAWWEQDANNNAQYWGSAAIKYMGLNDPATPSSIFTMFGTTKGFLPPVMTYPQWTAISSKAQGLLGYNTTTNRLLYYDGSTTHAVADSATSQPMAVTTAAGTTGTVSQPMGNVSVITITPTGNVTLNATGGTSGQICKIEVLTSGTTSYTVTFGTNFITTGTVTTGTVAGKYYSVAFHFNGSKWVQDGAIIGPM